jgi:hypothetical protein
MTHAEWLARAADMVGAGFCPNDLGVCLDAKGWCGLCRIRYRLVDGVVRVETAWDD